MKQREEAMLKRAVRAFEIYQKLTRDRNVHLFGDAVVVPEETLRLIEPNPKEWGYRKAKPKGWWASAYFQGTKFELWLSDEAHLDLGGYGVQ